MESIPVRGVINPAEHVMTVGPNEMVSQTAARMAERNVGSVLVVEGPENKVVGIMTERDLMKKIVARDRDPKTVSVGEIMTTQIKSCDPDTMVSEAHGMMVSHNIRHLPVLEDGKIVGILSSRDVLLHQLSSVQGIGYSLVRIVEQFQSVFPSMWPERNQPSA
jgi:CBS domain-containing protein